jgi:hypothetical protein
MNNLTQFRKKENLILLWEVLLDELDIKNDNPQLISNVKRIFDSNINPFISKANPQTNLIELNKIFLKQVSTAINRLMPGLKQQNIKKITISDEEIQQPYTIEDIHSFRQTEFEKKLEEQKKEFENAINIKKPKEVDFTYKEKESKITEMEHLIADTIARRKYELEEIQSTNYSSSSAPENWLNSQETSIKNEKITPMEETQFIQKKLKHINIEQPQSNTPVSILKSQKNVTWNDNNNEIIDNISLVVNEPSTSVPSLFNKLKQKPNSNPIQPISNSIKNDFVEDSLQPTITHSTNKVVNKTTNQNDNNNDIEKQLNKLYSKMDELQTMMTKIINLLETNKGNIELGMEDINTFT